MNMNDIEIIKKENGPSGKMYVEKYLKKYYLNIYENVISYCSKNLNDIMFKEKVYHYVNDLKNNISCKNPICNNLVKFKNSTLGYYEYCSLYCVSNDPNIKTIKENKSFKKYGTKAPGMNQSIKNKMIETNQKKYGSNSPLQNKEIKMKSQNTLFKNYGVDNPNKSKELGEKRIITYSKNMRSKYMNILKPIGIIDIDYKNKKIFFYCDNCKKNFEIPLDLFHNRKNSNTILCTFCNPIDSHISGQEILLQNFIKNNYNGKITLNDRELLKPYELDIFLPDLKIAFEFNGLFYHSERCVENNYHFKKTEMAEKIGIRLFQIYEDDWNYKSNIIESIIINLINPVKNKIDLNKCVIKNVDNKMSKNFLNINHIKGNINCSIKIGLFYDDEIISLMTFNNKKEKNYILNRFCNKLNMIINNSEKKLFDFFIENYYPDKIITYVDRGFENIDIYKKLGFELLSKSQPNYFYLMNKTRKNKLLFRKDILVKEGYDQNKTEHEIMLERKIYRIYDSGNLKFVWKKI